MREDKPALTREQRLAAKLRENLRRRKEQAREQARGADGPLPKSGPSS
jgi:FtsZ-binding cell division protein ZapB